MIIPDLAKEPEMVVTGMDPIIIRYYGFGVPGGATLDMTDFSENIVKAGHVIIYDTVNKCYKPMPVVDGAYDSLPGNCVYAGILVASVTKDAPFAGIMNDGEVNDVASPYDVSSIKADIIAALPKISFNHD